MTLRGSELWSRSARSAGRYFGHCSSCMRLSCCRLSTRTYFDTVRQDRTSRKTAERTRSGIVHFLKQSRSASNLSINGRTSKYPAVLQEVADNMEKYPGCVILTKVGGFYEFYFDQARELGALLNLKVAERKYVGGKVPMAGFPFFQLDRYLKILVQDLNRHVAISEEFPRTEAGKVKSGGLLFERRVARIVTPGTLVDEKFIQPSENNFLLAIHGSIGLDATVESTSPFGLAWMDLTTGELYTQATSFGNLASDLLRVNPREIVINQAISESNRQYLLQSLEKDAIALNHHSKVVQLKDTSEWNSRLESPVGVAEAANFTQDEVSAGSLLLEYAREQLLDSGMKLQPPVRRIETENMGIDRNTMRGLEILERASTSTAGGKGSLLHSVRRTVTKGGARLLRERISSPSTSIDIIKQRLDLVQVLVENSNLRTKLTSLLKQTFDSQRIAQKFALGKGDADDLIGLHRTIMVTRNIPELVEPFLETLDHQLKQAFFAKMSNLVLDSPLELAQTIAAAIDEDALLANHLVAMKDNVELVSKTHDILSASGNEEDAALIARRAKSQGIKLVTVRELDNDEIEVGVAESDSSNDDSNISGISLAESVIIDDDASKESWTMRRTASLELENLHAQLDLLYEAKLELTKTLQDTALANSLTLRSTPGLGHHVHVKGVKDMRNVIDRLPTVRRVSNSKSSRAFYLTEWSNLGAQIDQIKTKIKSEEQTVFQSLREQVIANLAYLRRNAIILDELDVSCSFATLSVEQDFTRPILDNSRSHKIIDGRHPTVMLGLEEQGRSFVSNDCLVGVDQQIWLITGPNMAGKSTYLRQNALISILAQVGCFVPAKHAEIGIVDQMFSRIGSADNLYQDQSTFMIEMLETANILNKATPRSFVIMDEVGRGTTPEDGIAVSYACLHHLYHVNKCRTLFATHFHALCDMTSSWSRLANYCTDVREDMDGSFSYVHRLRTGINRESHAIKVARLAGIPAKALSIAANVKASLRPKTPSQDESLEEVVPRALKRATA